jgi:hypothetical protein
MKYLQFAFILIILLFSENILSQDIITKKNGEEIKSKVTEVGEEAIKYKKFSNINGPTYSIYKVEVFMIKYENGEKDMFNDSNTNKTNTTAEVKINKDEYLKIDFKTFGTKYYKGDKKISKREFISKIEANPVAYNQYSLGKNLNTAGNVIGIPAGIVFGYNIGTWIGGGEQPNGAVLAVSGICWGGAIVLNYVGRSKIRNSIDTYNTSDKFGLNLNINQNGIGLALTF